MGCSTGPEQGQGRALGSAWLERAEGSPEAEDTWHGRALPER